MFGFKIYRVQGHSMDPTLKDGQLVIARKVSGRTVFKQGQVVVVNHPVYGQIIKRIVAKQGDAFLLAGDGEMSTPSGDMGLIAPQAIASVCIGCKSRPKA